MASPYQQQALQRKLIYAALILVLFTAAWVWRHYFVDAQAQQLALREENHGDVELTGAIVRLGLTGSRGFATCGLWWVAIEKQKKNQWNELEVLIRSLTKLQPHFIKPWLFQSWNLSYNVSVEADRVSDKYFFITRGINLLAEGERQNKNNPDMRWYIGFYNQHKICQSDETNTLRSLAQLSCIPPNERDPARFQRLRDGKPEIDEAEVEKFCQQHPQLVRRLREGMRRESDREQRRQFTCETVDEFLQLLADNFRLPSQWEETRPAPVGGWQEKPDKLRPLAERFPCLPPRRTVQAPQHIFDPNALTSDTQLTDRDDPYQISRAWYGYAQEPIPDADDMPGSVKPITDRMHQRRPRYMATILFRAYPAHAQRYTAERLEQEGWFDGEGYVLRDWITSHTPAPIGTETRWAAEAWGAALALWTRYGQDNHLELSEAEEENMRQLAGEFDVKYGLNEAAMVPQLRESSLDETTRKQYYAARFMRQYNQQRNLGNFPSHLHRARVESEDDTITARKLFFKAETARLRGSPVQALEYYNDPRALRAWRNKVLLKDRIYRQDFSTQENAYEIQLRYLDLYTELNSVQMRSQAAALAASPTQALAGSGACPTALAGWLPAVIRKDWSSPLLGGPFDGTDDEGQLIVSQTTRTTVAQRMSISRGAPQAKPTPTADTK